MRVNAPGDEVVGVRGGAGELAGQGARGLLVAGVERREGVGGVPVRAAAAQAGDELGVAAQVVPGRPARRRRRQRARRRADLPVLVPRHRPCHSPSALTRPAQCVLQQSAEPVTVTVMGDVPARLLPVDRTRVLGRQAAERRTPEVGAGMDVRTNTGGRAGTGPGRAVVDGATPRPGRAAALRERWFACSSALGWGAAAEWPDPAVDAVCAVVTARHAGTAARDRAVERALARWAGARAGAGVGLAETLTDLAALHTAVSGAGRRAGPGRPDALGPRRVPGSRPRTRRRAAAARGLAGLDRRGLRRPRRDRRRRPALGARERPLPADPPGRGLPRRPRPRPRRAARTTRWSSSRSTSATGAASRR